MKNLHLTVTFLILTMGSLLMAVVGCTDDTTQFASGGAGGTGGTTGPVTVGPTTSVGGSGGGAGGSNVICGDGNGDADEYFTVFEYEDGELVEVERKLGDTCPAIPDSPCGAANYVCTSDGTGVVCETYPQSVIDGEAGPDFPSHEEICDSIDNDCNGEIDDIDGDTCECNTGEMQACYSGPNGTENVGICEAGTQECVDGAWDECVGKILPQMEVCDGNMEDENCNGQNDEGGVCDVHTTTVNSDANGRKAVLCSSSWTAKAGDPAFVPNGPTFQADMVTGDHLIVVENAGDEQWSHTGSPPPNYEYVTECAPMASPTTNQDICDWAEAILFNSTANTMTTSMTVVSHPDPSACSGMEMVFDVRPM